MSASTIQRSFIGNQTETSEIFLAGIIGGVFAPHAISYALSRSLCNKSTTAIRQLLHSMSKHSKVAIGHVLKCLASCRLSRPALPQLRLSGKRLAAQEKRQKVEGTVAQGDSPCPTRAVSCIGTLR